MAAAGLAVNGDDLTDGFALPLAVTFGRAAALNSRSTAGADATGATSVAVAGVDGTDALAFLLGLSPRSTEAGEGAPDGRTSSAATNDEPGDSEGRDRFFRGASASSRSVFDDEGPSAGGAGDDALERLAGTDDASAAAGARLLAGASATGGPTETEANSLLLTLGR
jgi:hypothetical protein